MKPHHATTADLLVIGYGNELRRDDGVGPKVAAAVAAWNLPGIIGLPCHQLTPELADPIASARQVVFVDAAIGPSACAELRQLEPAASGQIMTHAADPRSLLGLAKQVFGRCPPACWLTLPVADLAFGEELSPLAQHGLQQALEKIRALITKPASAKIGSAFAK